MRSYDAVQLCGHLPAGMERGVLRYVQAGEVLDVFVDATTEQVYAAVQVGGREVYPRSATSVLRASAPRHLEDALSRIRHRQTGEAHGAGNVEIELWNASGRPAKVFVTVLYRAEAQAAPIECESGLTPEILAAAALLVAAIGFVVTFTLGHL